MEAYVKTFRLPPDVEICLAHDGSAGYGPDSYAIKVSLQLRDGTVISAEERMERNNYNHPEGQKIGHWTHHPVSEKIAAAISKLFKDYFRYLNAGPSSRLDVALSMEKDRVKLARAY